MEDIKEKTDFKAGFVSITGAPNAGKSTLLNHILGEKISIISKKPQTTRNKILGIAHRPNSQIIFIDTPGIHKPNRALNTGMVEQAVNVMGDVDIILFVIDVSYPSVESEDIILNKLISQNKDSILILNKIDLIQKPILLEFIDNWSKKYPFKAIIPISALKGDGIEDMLKTIDSFIPLGSPLYPDDAITDVTMRFIASEIIREKIFNLTGEELPYATAVTIESFTENLEKNLTSIHATIHVEKDSQKGIIIGKGGSKLKSIGESARMELEYKIETKVFLKLFVRVEKNWSRDTKAMRRLGYYNK
ncbi:MAG: GTPase Era [Desulfobacterales bacterium]|nr:GTPase Era [Desulfobacterales bacterium]